MNNIKGQILPESNFGQVLTRLAMNSQTIVEIGCWHGGGSTKCLVAGLVRPEQRMWSIDTSPAMVASAREINPDGRITFLCGTVLKPEECDIHGKDLYGQSRGDKLIPNDEPRRSLFFAEMKACESYPYIGDQLPEQIDLMLFDGGEFTSRFEFLKLYKRCKVIALDDIRRDVAWKNYQNHQGLMSPLNPTGWNLMFHRPFERNGWSVFYRVDKRPAGHLEPMCKGPEDIERVLASRPLFGTMTLWVPPDSRYYGQSCNCRIV